MAESPAQAEETAVRMAEIGTDHVVAGHCTGEAFIGAAERLMPGRVIRRYVGSIFTFGSRAAETGT